MKQIRISRRPGHELKIDADECIVYLRRAGLSAHMARAELRHNIIWVEDADVVPASSVLRANGFDL
jgi:nitrogen fixation protein